MIDSQELQAIRGRYATAEKAVTAVILHADDGLFGQLPDHEAPPLLTSAVASARDVPRLAAEVERLLPAAYLSGPEECCEGDCAEEDPPEGQWCSHVTEKVATFAEVKRLEYLEELVTTLRQIAEKAERGADLDNPSLAWVVLDEIAGAYERMEGDEDAAQVVSAQPLPDHGGDR